MRALYLESPRRVAIHDDPKPRLMGTGSRSIRIRTVRAGICGGELKIYRGTEPVTVPHFLGGHEWCGQVVDAGNDVRRFAVGDIVCQVFGNWCGRCRNCRLGHPNYCTGVEGAQPHTCEGGGGFAEFMTRYIPDHGCGIFKLPVDLPLEAGALAEPACCSIRGVFLSQAQAGEIALVIGLGSMGLLVTQQLYAKQVRVIGVDLLPGKLERAAKYCEWTVGPDTSCLSERIREITNGVGVDVSFEVVGKEETLNQAIEAPRMGGRLMVVGVPPEKPHRLDTNAIFRNDVTVTGCKGPYPLMNAQGEPFAFHYMREGIINVEDVATVYPMDDVERCWAAPDAGETAKAMMDWTT